eukprot:5272024-Amphidinium_carterae.3
MSFVLGHALGDNPVDELKKAKILENADLLQCFRFPMTIESLTGLFRVVQGCALCVDCSAPANVQHTIHARPDM